MKASGIRFTIGSILLLCVIGVLLFLTYSAEFNSRRDSGAIDNTKSVAGYIYHSVESGKKKLLKNLSFSFWDAVDIPGMPSSAQEDLKTRKIFSSSQCPQGICLTEDFLLLTSYSEGTDELGELFVFDRVSGSYLVTLGMNPKSHLGGVTFDGENVWICNSASNTIERISYDFVVLMAEQNKGDVVDASDMVDTFPVDNTPSCITYYDDRLWIATYSKNSDSVLVAYHYNRTLNEISALNRYQIPQKVQGIEFDDDGRVYLSTSYGRASSSYLKIYENIFALSGDFRHPELSVEMPPASEELALSDGTLYVLFESAAVKYYYGTDGRGISISPIDKILMLDVGGLWD